jgi:hypothetical protein
METDIPTGFSWQRVRSSEELGDFIRRRLAVLEHVALEIDAVE